MIEYRTFHNSDPPRLVALWDAAGLGRGAASGFLCDAWDFLVGSQPYFDPRGLILACEDAEVVGFVHAGFGIRGDQTALDTEAGVVCAIIVHPSRRRRGIGRELVRQAETYLRDRGARQLYAGESARRNPFYLGLYGGSQAAGFLESDSAAAPFFAALGYQSAEQTLVLQRPLAGPRDPSDFRLQAVRRKTEVSANDQPERPNWWWLTHWGRFDTVHFVLRPKGGGANLAEMTIWGMDLYSQSSGVRTVGLEGLSVVASEQRKGHATVLLVDSFKRLCQERVERVEVHAQAGDQPLVGFLKKLSFEQVDTGVVYART